MAQDHTKKEALFNEVKGSLFEYLVGKEIAVNSKDELTFQKSIDENYLRVLAQQDRMVRQFYPEMLPFLLDVSKKTVKKISDHFKSVPTSPKLTGKFTQNDSLQDLHETDLMVSINGEPTPLSLKLNKKNSFVNTKSGGIKSFFTTYFPYLTLEHQAKFNQLVDLEFERMSQDLHAFHEIEYPGNFSTWVKLGLSELPGELGKEEREILKGYYARIAKDMHRILTLAIDENKKAFTDSLLPLMGFGSKEMIQVICFHDFMNLDEITVDIHDQSELEKLLDFVKIVPFHQTASTEIELKNWDLQIRVKPMNKFTTTAIKINCSVRVKRPSEV